jgi:peptidoglycan/xylan/chitin deacetylase (PgdA/CDA1 family)
LTQTGKLDTIQPMNKYEVGRRKVLELSVKAAAGVILCSAIPIQIADAAPARQSASKPLPEANFIEEVPEFKIDRAEMLKRKAHVEKGSLMYHEVDSVQGFKQQMVGLLRSQHVPISLETLIEYLYGHTDINPNLPIFHVTLDDGRRSQLNAVEAVREIANETGIFIPLTLYVLSQYERKAMSVEELPENTWSYDDGDPNHVFLTKGEEKLVLEENHRLEDHTVHHSERLIFLEPESRDAEIKDGNDKVNALYRIMDKKRKYKTIAWPYGRFNGLTLQAAKNMGFAVGFSTTETTQLPGLEHLTIKRIGMS